MLTLNVPSNIVSDIASATSQTFDATMPLLVLMISVPLAFYVLRRLFGLFPRR
jgi:hypothetical protein